MTEISWKDIKYKWTDSTALIVCKCGEELVLSDEVVICNCGIKYRLKQVIEMEESNVIK